MLKMKDDPAICMKTNENLQNDRRKNGHNCITERKSGDILDALGANRFCWGPFRSSRRRRLMSGRDGSYAQAGDAKCI